jgi:predicted acylesterase/phospholipase RssA
MSEMQEPPIDRFCDLIMKGGITSGVVYPKAISLLAAKYRFRSIGGTSAGAIAAVVTAAAEYRRRKTQTRDGFNILAALPDQLKADVPGTAGTKLLSLFQPQPGTRRLFSVLVRSLNRSSTYPRIASIVLGLLTAYWMATMLSLALAFAARWAGLDWPGVAVLWLLLILLLLGIGLYRDVTRNAVANGFGLCTGLTSDPKNPALTPWLHGLIQRTAGLAPTDPPLTFGMLWNAGDFPPPWLTVPIGSKPRAIDLQMFSTNLSHGRPYIFPLPEVAKESAANFLPNRQRLFFNAAEMARYLPPDVLEWMNGRGITYAADPDRGNHEPSTEEAVLKGLKEVPAPCDFPVVVAARMSLSFPFLFAAVPLWSIDYDSPPGHRHFRRCWFSDGGISSNFPMHLFDGLVPSWPTFGINLEPKIPDWPEMVYLPQKYGEGYGERWDCFDQDQKSAARFGGFLSAILSTMQNWNDNSLARMPGVRDRIARVRLNSDEGGMNLNMQAPIIDAVAKRGMEAAEELLARFSEVEGSAQALGWDEQRFVRMSVLLKMLEARAPGVANAIGSNCAHATSYQTLIARWTDDGSTPDVIAPPGYERPLTPGQADALLRLVQELDKLSIAMMLPQNSTAFVSVPESELRVRPPL